MSFSFIFRQNDKEEQKTIRFTYMPNIWPELLAFGLNKSILGDWESEFRIRKIVWCLFFQSGWLEGAKVWKGDFCLLKVILLDVSAKLVIGKATPWKKWCLFAENPFFLFFQSWCLGRGRGLKKWFSLAACHKSFFHLSLELVPWAWTNEPPTHVLQIKKIQGNLKLKPCMFHIVQDILWGSSSQRPTCWADALPTELLTLWP